MGTFSIWHWIIVLAIVVLVFGTKKLRNLGGDLGSALKGFKEGMKEQDTDPSPFQSSHVNDQILEVEARKETKETSVHTVHKESPKEEQRTTVNPSSSPILSSKISTELSTNNPVTETEIKEKTQAKI